MSQNEHGHGVNGRTIDLSPLGECTPCISGRQIKHVPEEGKTFRTWRVWCTTFVIEEPDEEERGEQSGTPAERRLNGQHAGSLKLGIVWDSCYIFHV